MCILAGSLPVDSEFTKESSIVIGSYHLSGQEHVILPQHHQTHTLALPRTAQHTHQLLLAHACDIHTIDLNTHTVKNKLPLPMHCLFPNQAAAPEPKQPSGPHLQDAVSGLQASILDRSSAGQDVFDQDGAGAVD